MSSVFPPFFFLTLSLVISKVTVLQILKTHCVEPQCKVAFAMKNSESSIIKRLQTVRAVQPPLFYFYCQLFLYHFFPGMLCVGLVVRLKQFLL